VLNHLPEVLKHQKALKEDKKNAKKGAL